MNDPIADMLTGISNASMVGKTRVEVPASKFKKQILLVLKKLGYITDFKEVGDGVRRDFEIVLRYDAQGRSAITKAKRVSRLSKRSYLGYRKIRPVKYGHGHMIISTPEGIMTEKEARDKHIGGEALFTIW
ncbi:MAG: 30S ribosomal protein S8 [Patescibacteria group bacterium]